MIYSSDEIRRHSDVLGGICTAAVWVVLLVLMLVLPAVSIIPEKKYHSIQLLLDPLPSSTAQIAEISESSETGIPLKTEGVSSAVLTDPISPIDSTLSQEKTQQIQTVQEMPMPSVDTQKAIQTKPILKESTAQSETESLRASSEAQAEQKVSVPIKTETPAQNSAVPEKASSTSSAENLKTAEKSIKSVEQFVTVSDASSVRSGSSGADGGSGLSDEEWEKRFNSNDSVTVQGGGKVQSSQTQLAVADSLKGVAASGKMPEPVAEQVPVEKQNTSASDQKTVSKSLDRIESAVRKETAENAVAQTAEKTTQKEIALSEKSVSDRGSGKTLSNSEGTPFELVDKSFRTLLEPASPELLISEKNAALVQSSRTVLITFTILASGNVSPGTIAITPSSSVHPLIENELKEQIRKWRFSPAAKSGLVRFNYTIELKDN